MLHIIMIEISCLDDSIFNLSFLEKDISSLYLNVSVGKKDQNDLQKEARTVMTNGTLVYPGEHHFPYKKWGLPGCSMHGLVNVMT